MTYALFYCSLLILLLHYWTLIRSVDKITDEIDELQFKIKDLKLMIRSHKKDWIPRPEHSFKHDED